MKTLIVESWRFLPHSFSIVNQFQCLELLQRPDLKFFHREAPYFGQTWKPVSGLFESSEEETLRRIPIPSVEDIQSVDATFRFSYPFNLSPAGTSRTLVMGVSNFGMVPKTDYAGAASLSEATSRPNLWILAPSQWSREGFIRSGADPERVIVVRHGVDTKIFKSPQVEERQVLRKNLGWEDAFVFLHIGAMTQNKGMAFLLRSFLEVLDQHPESILVLKGLDELYRSKDLLAREGGSLSPAEAARISPHLRYVGDTLSIRQMATLYQAADIYVSPYMAEGFNLPVLEAIACGLPVICTAGGPTDDFTREDFACRISSTQETFLLQGEEALKLIPDQDHLTKLMLQTVSNSDFRAQARVAGPKFVAGDWTWKHVVDSLLSLF